MKNDLKLTDEEIKEQKHNITRDYVFKRLFSKKGNEKYLIDFLESLLNIKISNVQVIPESKIIKRFEKDKECSMDLRVNINNDIVVDVEMQREVDNSIEKRSLYYAGRIISDELKESENYKDIRSIIMINILNYNYTDLSQYITETVIVDKTHRDYEVIKDMKFYFIELPKFRKSEKNIKDKLTQWLALIDGTDRGLIEMAKEERRMIGDVEVIWKELTAEEEEKLIAEARWKAKLDNNSRMAYAKKEGKIEIAKKMLEMKLDINIIVEATGLTKEEIKNILH